MKALTLEKVFELLGTSDLAGSEKERQVLCVRIAELAELNGEEWIKINRAKLLAEWDTIVRHRSIK
jgi:hypothetical protein